MLLGLAIASASPALRPAGGEPVPPQEARLGISANPSAGYRPVLRASAVLADRALEEAVRSGLPLRLQTRVELWRDGFFDELVGDAEWTTVVTYDPLAQNFQVRSRGQPTVQAATYEAARNAVEVAYTLTLRPRESGRYYYTASLEIETLALSDLEELENWLKGELRPAVQGEGSVPEAVGTGVKRLFIRVLALPARRHEARSEEFRVR